MTTLQGEYAPSPWQWVRDQVAEYEASGGARANTLMDTGLPIIVVTTRGAKSGKRRKNPVMKVAGRNTVAMIVSCFMTTLRRLETVERWVSSAPVSRSR